jgi:hypothetical protein
LATLDLPTCVCLLSRFWRWIKRRQSTGPGLCGPSKQGLVRLFGVPFLRPPHIGRLRLVSPPKLSENARAIYFSSILDASLLLQYMC